MGYGLAYAWIKRDAAAVYRILGMPIFVMAFLSIGRIYKAIGNALGIPAALQPTGTPDPLRSLSRRSFWIAACGEGTFRLTWPGARPGPRWGKALCLTLFGLGFHDLWQHIKDCGVWIACLGSVWSILPSSTSPGNSSPNHPDPAYAAALGIGWGIALLSLVALIWLALRQFAVPWGRRGGGF